MNCLTEESKKNLLIVQDERVDELSKEYFIGNEGMSKLINLMNKHLKRVLHKLDNVNTHNNLKIEHSQSVDYDPNTFINSQHNHITNIQPGTFAYNKFQMINTQDVYLIEYENGFVIKLYFYYDRNYTDIQNVIQSIIYRLHLIIFTFDDKLDFKYLIKVFNSHNPLTSHTYLYDFNRNVNYVIKNNKLDNLQYYKENNCCHCSSGYSNSSYAEMHNNKIIDNSFEIVCTRIPEILGLFTHEMFHILHLDTRYYTIVDDGIQFELKSNEIQSEELMKILNKFNKKVSNYVFLETFNNTICTIFHALYCAIELNNNFSKECNYEKEFENVSKLFEDLIKKEILYSIFHTCKILYNQGITHFIDYFDDNAPYHQLAYLYEYTIVRSFMFILLDDYVRYLEFKDLNDSFNGNDKKMVDRVTGIIQDMLQKVYSLMYEDKDNSSRIAYSKLFNRFVEILDELSDNKKDKLKEQEKDKCGEMNMEYFCIDHHCNLCKLGNYLKGGRVSRNDNSYFRYKYLKYKHKYLKYKNHIIN